MHLGRYVIYSPIVEHPAKKTSSFDKTIFEDDLSSEIRKPLSELTLKGLRDKLSSLLNFINPIVEKQEVDSKTIAAYALQFVSNQTITRTLPHYVKRSY